MNFDLDKQERLLQELDSLVSKLQTDLASCVNIIAEIKENMTLEKTALSRTADDGVWGEMEIVVSNDIRPYSIRIREPRWADFPVRALSIFPNAVRMSFSWNGEQPSFEWAKWSNNRWMMRYCQPGSKWHDYPLTTQSNPQ